jgi:hypothetical protein
MSVFISKDLKYVRWPLITRKDAPGGKTDFTLECGHSQYRATSRCPAHTAYCGYCGRIWRWLIGTPEADVKGAEYGLKDIRREALRQLFAEVKRRDFNPVIEIGWQAVERFDTIRQTAAKTWLDAELARRCANCGSQNVRDTTVDESIHALLCKECNAVTQGGAVRKPTPEKREMVFATSHGGDHILLVDANVNDWVMGAWTADEESVANYLRNGADASKWEPTWPHHHRISDYGYEAGRTGRITDAYRLE